jgi:release factor glutamine methyltransferase
MNIQKLLNFGVKKLSKTSDSPALDAEVILSHLLDKTKEYLATNPDEKVAQKQEEKYKILINRRLLGWPVAYITKQKEFFGLKFYVDENVLIPRPETEGLIELVLAQVKSKKHFSILDIGTGCGAIIVSIAKSLNSAFASEAKQSLSKSKIASSLRSSQRQKYQFFASDVSKKSLAIAKKNTEFHNVKITFKQGSLLVPWKNQNFDILIANLPYLEKQTHPSTQFEPKKALIAKEKGLQLYKKLFEQISTLHPLPSTLFLEIGHDQGPQIKKLAKVFLPEYKLETFKDLQGRSRYVRLDQKSS